MLFRSGPLTRGGVQDTSDIYVNDGNNTMRDPNSLGITSLYGNLTNQLTRGGTGGEDLGDDDEHF